MCSAHWERRRVGRAYYVQWRLLASLVAARHDGFTVRASAEDACTLAEVKEEEEEEEEEEEPSRLICSEVPEYLLIFV